MVQADDAPLPPDTRINVLYGSNQEGEPYELGKPGRKQAVFCEEDTVQGGGPSESAEPGPGAMEGGGAGGAAGSDGAAPAPSEGDASTDVWALRCRLYTQGPARVDVTAEGYEPIKDRKLMFPEDDEDRCDVKAVITLTPAVPEMDD